MGRERLADIEAATFSAAAADRPATQITVAPTPAATLGQARAFRLLTEHFDGERGAYRDGWSDERIADDTGTATCLVTAIRRECFGEIRIDPEIEALQADIVRLEREADDFMEQHRRHIAEVKGRLLKITRTAAQLTKN